MTKTKEELATIKRNNQEEIEASSGSGGDQCEALVRIPWTQSRSKCYWVSLVPT